MENQCIPVEWKKWKNIYDLNTFTADNAPSAFALCLLQCLERAWRVLLSYELNGLILRRRNPDTSIEMDGSEDQPSTSSTKRMKYDAVRSLTDEELLKIIDDISTESDVEFEIEGSDENGSDEETDLQPSTGVSEADGSSRFA
nr:unnamed protein product [Callosobruchus chinensis]